MVQDPEGEGKIVYLFLPIYKVCRSNVVYPQIHTLPHSGETCKTLSTHTQSMAPTSPKKIWSGSSKERAKLSAPCTIIEPRSVLNLVRTHKRPRGTLVGFLESSNQVTSLNPNTIRMMRMMKGSPNPTGTRRAGTRIITRARFPSPTSSPAGKAEVRVGRNRAD